MEHRDSLGEVHGEIDLTVEQEYKVTWLKNYFLRGTVKVMARNEEDAKEQVMGMIGDFGMDDGKLDYDEGADYVEIG